MKKVNEAAALHWAGGALKGEVDVGIHDLSRVKLTVVCPEGAAVQRGPGSLGDGFEVAPAPETVTLAQALLFIQRSGLEGPSTFGLWKSCILEADDRDLKAKELMPPEAVRALREIQIAIPVEARAKKKTSAQRIGIGLVAISVERLTIESHLGELSSRRKRPRDAAAAR